MFVGTTSQIMQVEMENDFSPLFYLFIYYYFIFLVVEEHCRKNIELEGLNMAI